MNRRIRIVAPLGVLVIVGTVAWLAWRPRPEDQKLLSGYIEGEALYLAPPVSGIVTQMAVARGQRVDQGALLFTVDARSPSAQRDVAQGQVGQMQAQVDAAQAEFGQLRAAADAARATAAEARGEAERAAALKRDSPGAIAQQEVDKALAAASSASAQYAAARKQADAAGAQVGAAKGQLTQAHAALSDASARLSLVGSHAPSPARVEEVFYQTGEWAAANQPAVSLLPDDKIKLRFFVAEPLVATYRPGRQVRFGCDGCATGLTATIRYVSPRPEFTPPEIYSRKTRETLLFLVEAQPTDPKGLTPGLPVDVTPLAAPPGHDK